MHSPTIKDRPKTPMSNSMIEINSPQNARVKNLAKLRTARGRRRQDRILIEGGREVLRAMESSVPLEEVFFPLAALEQQQEQQQQVGADVAQCLERLEQAAPEQAPLVIGATSNVWRKLVVRGDDVQVLAVAKRPQGRLTDLTTPASPIVLVIESVEKPGNLGAMFRTADGAGVDAILLADPLCDWLNPNAIRSSLGAVFTVPTAADTNEAIRAYLSERHIQPLAAIVDAEQELWSADCTGGVAMVVGSEAHGLSAFWRQAVQPVRLPMRGAVDSLNVSATAAVMLYEAVRQRAAAQG